MSINSPIRALEKLSEEAKAERQKSTSALLENARMKIQLEGLKNHVYEVTKDNENLANTIEKLEAMVATLRDTNIQLESSSKQLKTQLASELQKSAELEGKEKAHSASQHNLARECDNSKQLIETLNQTIVDCESKLKSKDAIIVSTKDELGRSRYAIEDLEKKHEIITAQLNEQIRLTEVFKGKAQKGLEMSDRFDALQSSNDELRKELTQCLNLNNQLRVDLQDALRKEVSAKSREDTLQRELLAMKKEKECLEQTVKELEHIQAELSGRLEAEHETLETARKHAEVVGKGRSHLDKQLADLKDHYDESVARCRLLEQDVTTSKANSNLLEQEIVALREKVKQLEVLRDESDGAQNMAMEIEYLRSQLSEMRKALIKRDINDESSCLPLKSILEREQTSRAVYEGIIAELRTELDRLTVMYHESLQKVEFLMQKSCRVEQLEEEVRMYKEAAVSTAMESQSVSLSAAEALERSEKSNHEKHLILRDLKQVETELQSKVMQINRLQEELSQERLKSKKIHLEKLSAERKSSELLASKSRSEALADELKQNLDTELLELERCKRLIKEYTVTIHDLRKKCDEFEDQWKLMKDSEGVLKDAIADAHNRENVAVQDNKSLKQSLDIANREIDTLHGTVMNIKMLLSEAQEDIRKHRIVVEDLQSERDRYRKELVEAEGGGSKTQLVALRKELQQTVFDWKHTEEDKRVKEELVHNLQREIGVEKERNALLRGQVGSLEDRLKGALQELSVYRSLDVYNCTLQAELSAYRQTAVKDKHLSSSTSSMSPAIFKEFAQSAARFNESSRTIASSVTSTPMTINDITVSDVREDHTNQKLQFAKEGSELDREHSDDSEKEERPGNVAKPEKSQGKPEIQREIHDEKKDNPKLTTKSNVHSSALLSLRSPGLLSTPAASKPDHGHTPASGARVNPRFSVPTSIAHISKADYERAKSRLQMHK